MHVEVKRVKDGGKKNQKSRLVCASGKRAADLAVFARLPGAALQPAGPVSEEAECSSVLQQPARVSVTEYLVGWCTLLQRL